MSFKQEAPPRRQFVWLLVTWAVANLHVDAIVSPALLSTLRSRPHNSKDENVSSAFTSPQATPQLNLLGVHQGGQNFRQGVVPAGWFADFSESESSIDNDALTMYANKPLPKRVVDYGKDPGDFPSIYKNLPAKPAAWYAETESAGWYDAWQTFYPPPDQTVADQSQFNNKWRETPQGWVQDYNYAQEGGAYPKKKPAFWFDSDVLQYDGYGRRAEPSVKNPSRLLALDGWQERAVNSSLMCGQPGCQATTLLQLYDPNKEEAEACTLSVLVHPTDFEDTHSTELIEWILVNGKNIGACDPGTDGCNKTFVQPLWPCAQNLPINEFVSDSGAVFIEGKITQYVDECAYEGNLFAAVATITCMVRMAPARPLASGLAAEATDQPLIPSNADQLEMDNALNNAMADALNPENQVPVTPSPNPENSENPNNPESSSSPENPNNETSLPSPLNLTNPESSPESNSENNPENNPTNPNTPENPENAVPANAPNAAASYNPLAGTPYANHPELADNPLFNTAANAVANPLPNSMAAETPPIAGTGNVKLQCPTPGCTADATLNVNPLMIATAEKGAKCLLTVVVNQTDFDEDQGLIEEIEWVKAMDITVATNVKPGGNPCLKAYAADVGGPPVTDADKIYTVVSNYDVTSMISAGSSGGIPISGKITENVDECDSDGYLLDGMARIDCFANSDAVDAAANTNIQR